VVVDVSAPTGHLTRIKLDGNGLGMTLDQSQSRLYVAQDNADQVGAIDTSTNRVVQIDARAGGRAAPSLHRSRHVGGDARRTATRCMRSTADRTPSPSFR
jgi:hypothetical protein